MTDVRSWLAARTPAPPDALPIPLDESGTGGGPLPARLVEAAAERLERAVRGEGERRGAFELLAADALLTYACEAALESPDPEPVLLDLVARLGRRSG